MMPQCFLNKSCRSTVSVIRSRFGTFAVGESILKGSLLDTSSENYGWKANRCTLDRVHPAYCRATTTLMINFRGVHVVRDEGSVVMVNMGMWECGNMGIWEYENMRMWECANVGMVECRQ